MPIWRQSGVYKITNTVTGKFYLGSTSRSFKNRWRTHQLDFEQGKHCNEYLQHSWNKHGSENFLFEVLERCSPDRCLEREQYWLDTLKPWERDVGYNISKTVSPNILGRRHSTDARLKMSKVRKGRIPVQATKAAAIANRGKKRPPEVRAKISAGHLGRKQTEEARANIASSHWSKRPDAAEIIERSASKHRGKKRSSEATAKIVAKLLGGKRSEETKAKMAASRRRWWQERNAATIN